MLKPGDIAPNFSDKDQYGKTQTLPSGQWVLLYFYPRDNTPGCTIEACVLRDKFTDLSQHLQVFGVSNDTVDSHQSFSEEFKLPFPLLADTNKEIIEPYQAWGERELLGKISEGVIRISYLINPEGKVAKVYPQVNPAKHAQEVLEDIHTFKQS